MSNRLPALAWARQAAAGALEGLDWVDGALDGPDMVALDEEPPRFRGPLPNAQLPPALVEAALAAQAAGELPMAEALMTLLARPAWLVACRDLLWSPLSPCPALLTERVEAYGIGVELHRRDPERLARLTARLSTWHPGRGRVSAALALLERALGEDVRCRVIAGDDATAADLDGEVAACRTGAWWAARVAPESRPLWRVAGGFLRCESAAGPPARALREDVLVTLARGAAPPTGLLRLLPAWTSLRIATEIP